MTNKTATAYLVLTPKWSNWFKDDDGTYRLEGVRISRLAQKRPATIRGDELVMKVRIVVPSGAFKPLSPEASIVVPETLLISGDAIEASAVDPGATDD